eukprot:11402-Heterococcus_DN1.PRE.2
MKCPLDVYDVMESAVGGGSVPLLQFLVQEGCEFYNSTFALAAGAGSIPVLEYLKEADVGPNGADWLAAAALNGHLHVLRWAADNDTDGAIVWNDRELCSSAAQSGSIEMLQFLQEKGANLAEHNVSSDIEDWEEESITTAAARSDRKEVLRWLKEQGILPGVAAMREAAGLDLIDMCLFLHTECSCPWYDNLLRTASNAGYFQLVRALHEHGCPIDVRSVRKAAAHQGSVDMLQYLKQLPDQPVWTPQLWTSLLHIAGLNQQLAAAQWLRQQGAEWPAVLGTSHKQRWRGEALRWAFREGWLPADLDSEEDGDAAK